MFEDKEKSDAMLQAGAVSYLAKSAPAEEVVAAIRAAVAG